MTTENLEHAATSTYRIRRCTDSERTRRGYRGTFEVYDEATGLPLARCDMTGRAAQSVLEIRASDGARWTSTPNRRVMPTRWDLAVEADLLFRFDAKVAGKMFNPLHRTSIAAYDRNGVELFAVVDPRDSVPDRILGTGPVDWVLLKGDRIIGRIVNLPRRQPEPSGGVVARIRSILAGSDAGLTSYGDTPVLPAPAALALVAIHQELTDVSVD